MFLLSKLSLAVSHKAKLAFFSAHYMSHINYVSNAWDGCACEATVLSAQTSTWYNRTGWLGVKHQFTYLLALHKRAIKLLMSVRNMDYKRKCCALKLLPLDKTLLLNRCVLMQKVVHGKAPQYLKDPTIRSERLHVHGNEPLLLRTRTDIVKTSFSFLEKSEQ